MSVTHPASLATHLHAAFLSSPHPPTQSSYQSHLVTKRSLGPKRPVTYVRVLDSSPHVLALCENTPRVLDARSLENVSGACACARGGDWDWVGLDWLLTLFVVPVGILLGRRLPVVSGEEGGDDDDVYQEEAPARGGGH